MFLTSRCVRKKFFIAAKLDCSVVYLLALFEGAGGCCSIPRRKRLRDSVVDQRKNELIDLLFISVWKDSANKRSC